MIMAPAKINLSLQVGKRWSDGFHDIGSLFLALDFGDEIHAAVSARRGRATVEMLWRVPGIPRPANGIAPGDNIAARAAEVFRRESGWNRAVAITVEKRIPIGGGLGGGSSDAAAVLLALNRLAEEDGGRALGPETLAAMGAELGSDVPFFLSCFHAAAVGGRGERIAPAKVPPSLRGRPILLVNPGFPSGTARAFAMLDKYRKESRGRRPRSPFPLSRSPIPSGRLLPNDFLPAFAAEPAYASMLADLLGAGAVSVGLSGSGSTCFGFFRDREALEAAQERLSRLWPFAIAASALQSDGARSRM